MFCIALESIRRIGLQQEEGHFYASEGDYLYLLATFQYNRDSSIALSSSYQTMLRIRAKNLLQFQWAKMDILVPDKATGDGEGGKWISIQDYWLGAGVTVDGALKAAKTTGVMVQKPFDPQTAVHVPYRLYGPMVAEGGFYRHPVTKEWHIISLVFTERYFQLCTSASLVTVRKPWSCRYVYEVPAQYMQVHMVHYAAKAHPYLLERPCATARSFQQVQALIHQAMNQSSSSGNSVGSSSLAEVTWDMIYSFLTNAVTPHLLFEPEFRDIYLPRFVHLQKQRQP
jgi:hypothetical protein